MEGRRLTPKSSQARTSPIIVGERYELAEALAATYSGGLYGGLPAKPVYDAALLPMSGYRKSTIADLNGLDARRPSDSFASFPHYDARRASQDPMYLQYSLPGQADAQVQPSTTVYDRHADQIVHGASSAYQDRTSYEATAIPYNDVALHKAPDVSEYIPKQGTYETQVSVYLDSPMELLEPVSLLFGKSRVPAIPQRLETFPHDICYKYVVSASAPAFSSTESASPRVPLRIQMQESSEMGAGLKQVGPWFYEDAQQHELRSAQDFTRKRKMTLEEPENAMAIKRLSPTRPSTVDSQDYGSYSYTEPGEAYSLGVQSIDRDTMQKRFTPYGRSEDQQSHQEDLLSSNVQDFSSGATYAQSATYAQPHLRPPMIHASSYSPYATHQTIRSPALSSTASFQVSSSSSPNPGNPPLVRASTLQPQPASISAPTPSSSEGTLSPYGTYPKANIKIRGDLNKMQDDWTAEERSAKRRLVQFRGEQSGSTINTYFKAVKPDERPSSSETREKRVSCIYWEERDEYYVTSVDTIALLETLVGSRFEVEEKNRIRRNLETHHPLTVFKSKPETESFFKVIMGFPNPKPRNIEKDVKVFQWPILAQALIKVISKYSANPASTAGSLPAPLISTTRGCHSDSSSDRYTHLPSRSSTGSSAYASTLKSSLFSPTTAPHHLPAQYPSASPLHASMSGLSNVQVGPTVAGCHSQSNVTSIPSQTYDNQASLSDFSHAYTGAAISRRRSSDAAGGTFGWSHHTTRPRANTSFSSLYQSTLPTQGGSDFTVGQLPSNMQPPRPSWDLSALFKMPSRQNSLASQYPTEDTRPETSQSTV